MRYRHVFCSKIRQVSSWGFDVVESSRKRRGHLPLPDGHKLDLKDKIRFYIEMCEGLRTKLSEVKERIRGQINMVGTPI
jgi:hypothetical protein